MDSNGTVEVEQPTAAGANAERRDDGDVEAMQRLRGALSILARGAIRSVIADHMMDGASREC
jgi:hypothetical protein